MKASKHNVTSTCGFVIRHVFCGKGRQWPTRIINSLVMQWPVERCLAERKMLCSLLLAVKDRVCLDKDISHKVHHSEQFLRESYGPCMLYFEVDICSLEGGGFCSQKTWHVIFMSERYLNHYKLWVWLTCDLLLFTSMSFELIWQSVVVDHEVEIFQYLCDDLPVVEVLENLAS